MYIYKEEKLTQDVKLILTCLVVRNQTYYYTKRKFLIIMTIPKDPRDDLRDIQSVSKKKQRTKKTKETKTQLLPN